MRIVVKINRWQQFDLKSPSFCCIKLLRASNSESYSDSYSDSYSYSDSDSDHYFDFVYIIS